MKAKWSLVIALALVVASVGGYCYEPARAGRSAGSETATYSVADIAGKLRPAVVQVISKAMVWNPHTGEISKRKRAMAPACALTTAAIS